MPKAKSKKTDKPPEPDDLVRQAAGTYLSGDGRFEVQQSDSTWFLLDTHQTNEFGQEIIHGPYPALKAVREAIPQARKVTALPRPPSASAKKPRSEKGRARKPAGQQGTAPTTAQLDRSIGRR